MATKKPTFTPPSVGSPQKNLITALGRIVAEIGALGCEPCSGPPWPKTYAPT